MFRAADVLNASERKASPPQAKRRKTLTNNPSLPDEKRYDVIDQNGSSVQPDERLDSRQFFVLDQDVVRLMANSDVLICGMRGLGFKTAKRVVLGGIVRSVTVYEESSCEVADLSSGFFIPEMGLSINGTELCAKRLTEWNSCVQVFSYNGPLTEDYISSFSVVVLTAYALENQLRISEFARKRGIAVIVASNPGLFGNISCDFRGNFVDAEITSEETAFATMAFVSKNQKAAETCLEGSVHGFENDHYVTFSEVQGPAECKNYQPHKIKALEPCTFSVGNNTAFTDYWRGGLATQEHLPKIVRFQSSREGLEESALDFVTSGIEKMDRPAQLHHGFQALDGFQKTPSRSPGTCIKEVADGLVSRCQEFNQSRLCKTETLQDHIYFRVVETFLKRHSRLRNEWSSQADATEMVSVSQEINKSIQFKAEKLEDHIGFKVLEEFLKRHDYIPEAWKKDDSDELASICQELMK